MAVISVGVLGILEAVGDFSGLATALPDGIGRCLGEAFEVLFA